MSAIHNVLAAACQAIKVPTVQYESYGKPVVDDPRYDDLAAWIARQATPKLSKAQSAELAKLFALLEKAKTKKLAREEQRAFDCDEDATDLPDGDIVVSGLKMYAVKGARRAACAAARLLGPPFLDALAKELWRLDAITLVVKQKLRPKAHNRGSLGREPQIHESLWRGATGARVTHQIVRLDGESYGLIAKTRGRWTWSEGTRDDILASVPDALMESAVAVVVGGQRARRAAPLKRGASGGADARGRSGASKGAAVGASPGVGELRPVILALDDADKLVAVAMGADGTAYALTKRGRLGMMPAAATSFTWTEADAKGVRGMTVSKRGTVLTWGADVITWRAGKPVRVAPSAAEGAHIGDDDGVTWWSDDTVVLPGKKRVRGFAGQTVAVLARKERVLAIGRSGTRVFDLTTGKALPELPIRGAMHAVSPDEERVATWDTGAKAREVRVFATKDGKELAASKLDSGKIDAVVFTTDDRIFVRYHDRIRVAALDASGKQTHRIDGRQLGSPGSAVRVVFLLSRGEVLAFASYPRGEAVVVDADAQTLARWSLGTLYVGGHTRFAEGGGRAILTHDHLVQRVLVF